jgi:hypothetical protein
VFIDTGSYELWVNPRCNTSASESICQSHGNYYPKKSSSSTWVGGKFAVTYGTGAVRGSYWSDVMSIASKCLSLSFEPVLSFRGLQAASVPDTPGPVRRRRRQQLHFFGHPGTRIRLPLFYQLPQRAEPDGLTEDDLGAHLQLGTGWRPRQLQYVSCRISVSRLRVPDCDAGEIIFGGINRWKFAGPLEPVSIWPPISQQDPRWIQ